MMRALCLIAFAAAAHAQDPADTAFATQRDAIVPHGDEIEWQTVAWEPELRTAVLAADRDDKPVLLWAMNGHPLGQC